MTARPTFIQPRPGEFFAWSEFTLVRPGWTVLPLDIPVQRALVQLCTAVLDPLRRHLGQPVIVSRGGGVRSVAYNRHIRGSASSQHIRGEASDIHSPGLSARELVRVAVAELALPVDQIISYEPALGGHVHASHTTRRPNRGVVLHCFRNAAGDKAYRSWTP